MARRSRRRGAVLARVAAVALAIGAIACSSRPGAPPDPCFSSEPERCFVSHGARVMLDGAVARERAAVERAIGRALAYWSAPPDALEG